MDKNDYLALFFIVVLAAALRIWGVAGAQIDGFDTNMQIALGLPSNFADFAYMLEANSHAIVHYYYQEAMRNLGILNGYSSAILGVFSVISMFFVGLEFAGDKKGKNTALFCALITGIAPLLIYFAGAINPYSLSFLLTTLVILFSLRIFNSKKKSGAKNSWNWVFLIIFSILLLFEHNISIVFVTIAMIALFVFKDKKSVMEGNFQKLFGALILLLPAILFALAKAGKFIFPFLAEISPISGARIFFSLSDLFSFYTVNASNLNTLPTFSNLIHNKITLGVGFVVFVILPTLIAAICILKNFIKPKKADFYLVITAISTFFTVLILSSIANFNFLTKYIIEIYPILILLFASGLTTFKSKSTKVVLLTLFMVLNLFYLTNLNTTAKKLVENIPQNIPKNIS